ncbi:MAG: GMC family oxidoreductase [Nitrososphaeraceae archaeon]
MRRAEDEISEHYDFVIIGSGAGGGPLAANLAEAGFRALLLEAGADHQCPYYEVPLMQARASEDSEMRWDFFVRHYAADESQRHDSKFVETENGVLYPRGATLGGSTAISALVTVYPHNSDWNKIAEVIADNSWEADQMRRYLERIEHWQGPDANQATPALEGDESRHGFAGWLKVRRADPNLAGREPYFLQIINAIEQTSRDLLKTSKESTLPNDPNDWRFVRDHREGMSFIPVAIDEGMQNGGRERILAAQNAHPDHLIIRLNALATRILFDKDRAVGVEYMNGSHLYAADPSSDRSKTTGEIQKVFADREVILAGGAFNTPQILKLSGVGPRKELEALGIPVVIDSPGVGENLQDRYEVTVVDQLISDYGLFEGATLNVPLPKVEGDPLFREWQRGRSGPYSTNGR